MKNKNSELLTKLDEASTTLKSFEGIDPEKMKFMMAQLDQSEEAGLIADGKIDEVVERRVDKQRLGYEDKIKSLQDELTANTEERNSYKNRFETQKINDQVRAAAIKAGVLPNAIEDVLSKSNGVFQYSDSSGDIESRDKDGQLNRSANGELLTADRFVESLNNSYPVTK